MCPARGTAGGTRVAAGRAGSGAVAGDPARGGGDGTDVEHGRAVPGAGGEGGVTAVDEARRLAPRFAARAAAHDRDGTFPVDDFADMRAAGLFGLMVPERLGGLGAGFARYADVAYELARGNGATALVFNMHASVTGALAGISPTMVSALGVPDEFFDNRDEILRRAARGACYGVAMSERGAGARLSQLATVYGPEAGGYRIKGAKTFCSGAGHADAYLVAARAVDDPQTVSQFLVP